MKIVRYFLCCICIVFCLVMTNELRAIYFHRVIKADQTHFQLTEGAVSQTELEKLADQFDVLIYCFDQTDSIHDAETVFDIYTTAQAEAYFPSALFCNRNSIFYGKIKVTIHALHDYHETESAYYRMKGDPAQREAFLALMQEKGALEESSVNAVSYDKTYTHIMLLMWGAIAVFLLLLSIYYVSIMKREQMIAVTYGKSLSSVVFLHMLEDGIIIGGICLISSLLAKRVLFLQLDLEILLFLGSIFVLCLLPNLLYGIFELKLIKNENKSLRRTVRFSVLFKWCASVFLIPVFVMELGSVSELYHAYQAVEQLDFLNEHQIIQLHTQDTSLVPDEVMGDCKDDDHLRSSYADDILYNRIYRKYLDFNNIVVLRGNQYAMPDGSKQHYSLLYCNKHTKDYIILKFPQFQNDIEKAETEQSYLFIEPNSKLIPECKVDLSQYTDLQSRAWSFNPNIIPDPKICVYNSDTELYSFCMSVPGYILLTENPYIVLDFRPPNDAAVDTESQNEYMALKPDDALIKELQSDPAVSYKFFPIGDSVQYIIYEAKRHLYAALLLVLSLFALNVMMTCCIQSFDFRLNMKQYAIQKALGVSPARKYSRIILLVILPYLAAIPFSLFVFNQKMSVCFICAAVCLFSDVCILWILIARTEAKQVMKLIKGGFS